MTSSRAKGLSVSEGLALRLQAEWLRRGWIARLLFPVALVYGGIWRLREWCYHTGLYRSYRAAVPVVVVGNLIAGGAGKTPTVLAIVQHLQRAGWRPGIVSRGHGGSARTAVDVKPNTPSTWCGDEPLLLRLRSGVPVVVHRKRAEAARMLLAVHPTTNILVCDDALQHRAIQRDVEVIVFDERGIGNGWLLPAGPLREPFAKAAPPRSLVIYNAPSPTTPWAGHLAHAQLLGLVRLHAWWLGDAPDAASIPFLQGRTVWACAGVARPQRFFALLATAGITPQTIDLPDHFDFRSPPWPADATDVVVTEKDATKIAPEADLPDAIAQSHSGARHAGPRIWVAPLDFTLPPVFWTALDALLPLPKKATDGNSFA